MFDRLQNEIDRREQVEGISPADLLDLPDDLRRLVQTVARRGQMSRSQLAAKLDLDPDDAASLLDQLEEKGLLERTGPPDDPRYKAAFARRRGREIPFDIWEALTERVDEEEE
jgi:DNA-binding MarR family transcriptional regulator